MTNNLKAWYQRHLWKRKISPNFSVDRWPTVTNQTRNSWYQDGMPEDNRTNSWVVIVIATLANNTFKEAFLSDWTLGTLWLNHVYFTSSVCETLYKGAQDARYRLKSEQHCCSTTSGCLYDGPSTLMWQRNKKSTFKFWIAFRLSFYWKLSLLSFFGLLTSAELKQRLNCTIN